jgi:prepilin-type N-terminal cleavage/methylation domain-containing protein
MKTTPVSRHSGFTLVELMVAAAASLIVIGVTISSLVTLQQMNQRLEDRLTQEAEIQRSLHFIAADIQEGKLIKADAPKLSDYREMFHIVRPDGSTIGYYTTSRGTLKWSGPQIIYRRDSLEKETYALVDQISAQPPRQCTEKDIKDKVKDILVRNEKVGFSLVIYNQTRAIICIRGHLLDSPEGIEASIQAATRTGP